jgi:7-cyano-7-deazaguanine synthase in queuosine biosynthesis
MLFREVISIYCDNYPSHTKHITKMLRLSTLKEVVRIVKNVLHFFLINRISLLRNVRSTYQSLLTCYYRSRLFK